MNEFIKPPFEKLKYYPDNDGVPGIKFLGTETKKNEDGIIWIFHDAEERDMCFEKIENNRWQISEIERVHNLIHEQFISYRKDKNENNNI